MLKRNFILGGKAIFTVRSVTGEHLTFRVLRKDACEKYPEAFFAHLLTGPDNTADYTYMGKLDPKTGVVSLTRASRYGDESKPMKVANWALKHAFEEKELPEGYAMYHMGLCGRCGRPLTVPESVESGFGPECIKKV
jgi:hypothetical protein